MDARLLLQTLNNLVKHLPSRCLLCQRPTRQQDNLCLYCRNDLTYFDYQRFDNLLLRPDIADGLTKPRFEQLISLAPYDWPFSQWISELKFHQQFNHGTNLAIQLAGLLSHLIGRTPSLKPQRLIPMPIHRKRQFKRGYNQSTLIARHLAKVLNIPLDETNLKRIKATRAQTDLGAKSRRQNVKNAFVYSGPPLSHVALVDDVITTGSTANEVCKVLKDKGIEQISVWTVCATPKQQRTGIK